MAIKVLNKLIITYPHATLCMVGPDKDGSMKKCVRLVDKLNLKKNVTFKGLLTKKEWIGLSVAKDIFINTTNFDNMPVSVIEAMALGFPIVSTDAGGLIYLHKNNEDALLVKKNDIDSMVENIIKIIENKKLAQKLSINARSKAEKFSWEIVKPIWEDVLD